ncbi:hypothetical protein DIPPA_31736 [Diplonema papillatum]|nr:hypothetical protein DIPPA_31736 [Diplonema papillatum]|eukprot:gene15059-22990_t
MDAEQLYAAQGEKEDAIRQELSRFVVSILAADHHYQKTTQEEKPWVIPPDCHALLHNVRLRNVERREMDMAAFVYHFTLPDIHARGHVRPHCIVYLTHQPSKLIPYYGKLKEWISHAIAPWKLGTYRYCVSRALSIIRGAVTLLKFMKSKSRVQQPRDVGEREKVEKVATDHFDDLNELQQCGGVSSNGSEGNGRGAVDRGARGGPSGSTTPNNPNLAPTSNHSASSNNAGVSLKDPTPQQPQPSSWLSRLNFWRSPDADNGMSDSSLPVAGIEREVESLKHMIQCLKELIPDCTVEDPTAAVDPPEGWAEFLTRFIQKNPATRALPPLVQIVGDQLWTLGKKRLVSLVLCVMDRSEMELTLYEQDWRSVHQSYQHNSALCFGGKLALGTNLQADCSFPAPFSSPYTSPASSILSPFSHPPESGLLQLFDRYPHILKHVVYSLMSGRPVFVVGSEQQTDTISVGKVTDILETFVMSTGERSSGVVKWHRGDVTLTHLAGLRLCGIRSVSQLRNPVLKYCSVFKLAGAGEYHGPIYPGRYLEELFGSKKHPRSSSGWACEATFASFVQAWLLQIGLIATVVYHSTLLNIPLPDIDSHHLSSVSGGLIKADTASSANDGRLGGRSLEKEWEGTAGTAGSSYGLAKEGSCTFDHQTSSPLSGAMLSEQCVLAEFSSKAVGDSPHGDSPSPQGGNDATLLRSSTRNLKPTQTSPSPAAVAAATQTQQLSKLGVSEGDAEIIRHAVRLLSESAVEQTSKTLVTSLAQPLTAPTAHVTREDKDPVPFPMIRLGPAVH